MKGVRNIQFLIIAVLLAGSCMMYLVFLREHVPFSKALFKSTKRGENDARAHTQHANITADCANDNTTQTHHSEKEWSMLDQSRPKLIILAYMRSGSSLTGDIIQQHPKVFYVYEPLFTVENYYNINNFSTLDYFDGTSLPVPKSLDDLLASYLDIIQSVFRCHIDKLDITTLQQLHMAHSRSTGNMWTCLHRELPVSKEQALVNCVQPVISSCNAAGFLAIKFIRMNMRQVGLLMSSDPRLKVIHLIRDPRGILLGRAYFGLFKEGEEEEYVDNLCPQMLQNIQISKVLSKRMPQRILTMRYEDLAEAPVKAAQQLYNFIDLDLTPSIEKYIKEITYSGLPEECNICTTKPNATEAAYKWRKELPFKSMSIIQDKCAKLMDTMGYLPLDSVSDVQNFQIPVKDKTFDPELMRVTV